LRVSNLDQAAFYEVGSSGLKMTLAVNAPRTESDLRVIEASYCQELCGKDFLEKMVVLEKTAENETGDDGLSPERREELCRALLWYFFLLLMAETLLACFFDNR